MLENQDLDSSCEPSALRNLTDVQKKRLTDLLDQYLCGLESGEALDSELFASQNPDIADIFREYIDRLNSLHEIALGFQSNAIGNSTEFLALGEGPMVLGDFTILQEIGRGGMGVVYEARQQSLNRNVAVKLLPMASLLDSRQVARFKNEAHAAGLLSHPNIVPVFSIGVERGIHFYAMQLIDGVPIDAWIRERSAETDDSTNQDDSWREVVRWAIDIAGALHSAHETGVVHRDVKPSNLLLDTQQKIWITDFGLARCQNDLGLTLSNDLLGTMRYMSPEQAMGKAENVDHRTDIYSLAATVFEMLSLRPAVLGDDGPSIIRSLENEEPPKLRQFAPRAPRDLDVVLQKAMAKRKDDRYESSRQFAEDLLAVLENRPTLAKPPSIVLQLGRWTVKHRRPVALGTGVFSLAIVWLVFSSLMILQKSHDAIFSELRADRYFRQAQATVGKLGMETAERLAAVPGSESVRQSLLNETLAYYERFVATAAGDPKLESELALTQSRIGSLVKEMASSAKAIPHFRQSAKRYVAILKVNPSDTETRKYAAENLNQLGLSLMESGEFDEATENYRQAIAIQEQLTAEAPSDIRMATELALTKNNLGLLLRETGQRMAACQLFNESIEMLSSIAKQESQNELVSRALAASLANLSATTPNNDLGHTIQLLNQAITIRLKAVSGESNQLRSSSEIAKLYNNLGAAHLQKNDLLLAQKSFSDAIRLQRQLHTIAPMVLQHRRDLATYLNNLAMVQQRNSQFFEASSSSEEAVELQSFTLEKNRSDQGHAISQLGAMEHNLANALQALGESSRAEATLMKAIDHQKSALNSISVAPQAKKYLQEHYSTLLRWQTRDQRWNEFAVTSIEYRKAAEDDPQALLHVATDLAEATKWSPAGSVRQRSIETIAGTLAQAKAAGATLPSSLLESEPFRFLQIESKIQNVVNK